jgi:hypothetical protein
MDTISAFGRQKEIFIKDFSGCKSLQEINESYFLSNKQEAFSKNNISLALV